MSLLHKFVSRFKSRAVGLLINKLTVQLNPSLLPLHPLLVGSLKIEPPVLSNSILYLFPTSTKNKIRRRGRNWYFEFGLLSPYFQKKFGCKWNTICVFGTKTNPALPGGDSCLAIKFGLVSKQLLCWFKQKNGNKPLLLVNTKHVVKLGLSFATV